MIASTRGTVVAVSLVVMLVLTACNRGRAGTATPTSTPPGSTLPTAPVAAGVATTNSVLPSPANASVISATGSRLQPPTVPDTIAAEQDCHRLLTQPSAIASISACATATGPSGTVTGTNESYAHSQQWDVWKRNGNDADLVLTYTGNFQSTPGFVFHSADPANDAHPKLLAVEHIPGTELVSALDIIETSGAVVAHITLGTKGGVAGPALGGGIETWAASGSGSATATVIRYVNDAWRAISASSVPTSKVPAFPNGDGFGGGLP